MLNIFDQSLFFAKTIFYTFWEDILEQDPCVLFGVSDHTVTVRFHSDAVGDSWLEGDTCGAPLLPDTTQAKLKPSCENRRMACRIHAVAACLRPPRQRETDREREINEREKERDQGEKARDQGERVTDRPCGASQLVHCADSRAYINCAAVRRTTVAALRTETTGVNPH